MMGYDEYAALNQRLMQGQRWYISGRPGTERISRYRSDESRLLYYPRIGVYTGSGASHSWLWVAEMLDRMGFHDVAFLDAAGVQNGLLEGMDVLMVSGGDTFAAANALGPAGALAIAHFVSRGGLYIGACAGAYLVMNSSKPGLADFNFTAVKITNLSKSLPACFQMPHKFSTSYGCDYIFHPVRETVRLRIDGHLPFAPDEELDAPLYGGAGMLASRDVQVLACYHAFTPDTAFLVDPGLASETLLGTAAALRSPMGNGWFYLFGPHFEHPRYPAANAFLADAIFWDSQPNSAGRHTAEAPPLASEAESRRLLKDIKREVSNARICAGGMEMLPIGWLIGAKYYEPEKIRYFLEAIWHRLQRLEKGGRVRCSDEQAQRLRRFSIATTERVRQLKQNIESTEGTRDLAESLFSLLQCYAVTFLELYFQTLSNPTFNSRS
ncbi:BPL-N domain-containing protein [Desulfatitalea alkaliphila]|uniref:Biotin-protein ligase N-terminal domain-containing protein n=1 Tax=Desulfatitalea alkaliphila TaxID=2929485 RepID=A0AA41R5K7_9BACT|nr:BPL-N domain-containing protein [Desulfatitalea alkaliphila]MCJ8499598.1 hypothetical protein [Desulfatitalea alkaliphila]